MVRDKIVACVYVCRPRSRRCRLAHDTGRRFFDHYKRGCVLVLDLIWYHLLELRLLLDLQCDDGDSSRPAHCLRWA
jgi:hypothetical protein